MSPGQNYDDVPEEVRRGAGPLPPWLTERTDTSGIEEELRSLAAKAKALTSSPYAAFVEDRLSHGDNPNAIMQGIENALDALPGWRRDDPALSATEFANMLNTARFDAARLTRECISGTEFANMLNTTRESNFTRLINEAERLRAALDACRMDVTDRTRERDYHAELVDRLMVRVGVQDANADLLRAALTAAEQRAQATERELTGLRAALGSWLVWRDDPDAIDVDGLYADCAALLARAEGGADAV